MLKIKSYLIAKWKNPSLYCCLAIIFFLSFFMMLRQLVTPGYFTVQHYDIEAYTSMALQFQESLHEDVTYPRWMPLNFWGYGSPTFILYSPLAYYMTAFMYALSGSIAFSMNFVKFGAFLISSIGMFFMVKEFYPVKIALLTSVFFILLPFHIFQLYLVESFASAVSFVWFAPILLFTHRYINSRHFRYLVYAGACYGGLIFTYILHGYMFAFVFAAYVLFLSVSEKKTALLFVIPFIIAVGILVSAAHILPFIFESQFLNTKTLVSTSGPSVYHYSLGFLIPDTSESNPPGTFWYVYRNSYLNHTLLLLCSTIVSIISIWQLNSYHYMKHTNIINKFFILIALVSIILLFGISSFLWETIPFFKYIHLPKRWLNITSFAAAFLSASIFMRLETGHQSKIYKYSFVILFLLLFTLQDFDYINRANIFTEKELMPSKGVNLALEHLPAGVRIDKVDHNEIQEKNADIISGVGKIASLSWKSEQRTFRISAMQPLTLRVRTFNFPGWTAYLDDVRTKIREENDTKAILVDVPPGNHSLKLVFEDTPVRFYGKLISIVSLLSFLAFMLMDIIRSRKAAIHG